MLRQSSLLRRKNATRKERLDDPSFFIDNQFGVLAYFCVCVGLMVRAVKFEPPFLVCVSARDEVLSRPVAKSIFAGSLATGNKGGVDLMCYGGRRFLTKEEKVEWLEEYKSNLESELKGVTERIEELKHGSV